MPSRSIDSLTRSIAGPALGAGLLLCVSVAGAEEPGPVLADESPRVAGLMTAARADEQARDHTLAAQHYCEAAREGSAEAMFRLGRLYSVGLGVKRDNATAASLLGAASRLGHAGAQQMLGDLPVPEGLAPDCDKLLVVDAGKTASAEVPQPRSTAHYASTLAPEKRKLVKVIETLAARYKVDPRLVLAVITAESGFDAAAVSPKNAQGLMQLIPETAERFNVADPLHPEQNLKGGIAYLRWLLAYFRGDVQLALAGYNAGERAVDRYRGVPPYEETRAYVKRVLDLYPLATHPYEDGLVAPSVTVIERDARVEARKRRM